MAERLNRQRKNEPAPFAGFALHPKLSAVQLDEFFRQRQSKSGSLRLATVSLCRQSLKLEKNPLVILLRYTRAGIAHFDAGVTVLATRAEPYGAAVWSELDGIAEKVEQHLPDARHIHWYRPDFTVAFHAHRDLFLSGKGAHRLLHRI